MKSTLNLLTLGFTLLLFISVTYSQNLLTEDFNYPVRDSLQGIGSWNIGGGYNPYNVKVVSPGLVYSGYVGSGIGNTSHLSNNPNGSIVLKNFTTQTSGSLYMAFMIRVDSLTSTATQGYNIGFDPAGGSTEHNTRLYVKKVSATTFNFGIKKIGGGSVSWAPAVYNTNTTYLVVLNYLFVAGSNNDISNMYIFTSTIPANEPASPDASDAVGSDLSNQGQVFLSNMYAQGPPALAGSSVKIDGIRIGTSWQWVIMTSVQNISDEIPDGFTLSQNYPNPFNPSTKIKFTIPKSDFVTLKVYDIAGREISVLINQNMNAGVYTVDFGSDGLVSGVYFYKITSGDFVDTKKMTLVK